MSPKNSVADDDKEEARNEFSTKQSVDWHEITDKINTTKDQLETAESAMYSYGELTNTMSDKVDQLKSALKEEAKNNKTVTTEGRTITSPNGNTTYIPGTSKYVKTDKYIQLERELEAAQKLYELYKIQSYDSQNEFNRLNEELEKLEQEREEINNRKFEDYYLSRMSKSEYEDYLDKKETQESKMIVATAKRYKGAAKANTEEIVGSNGAVYSSVDTSSLEEMGYDQSIALNLISSATAETNKAIESLNTELSSQLSKMSSILSNQIIEANSQAILESTLKIQKNIDVPLSTINKNLISLYDRMDKLSVTVNSSGTSYNAITTATGKTRVYR